MVLPGPLPSRAQTTRTSNSTWISASGWKLLRATTSSAVAVLTRYPWLSSARRAASQVCASVAAYTRVWVVVESNSSGS